MKEKQSADNWRKPSSVMRKIERYFEQNPDEWLSFEDARQKFGLTEGSMRNAFCRLRMEGMELETVRVIRLRPQDESAKQ